MEDHRSTDTEPHLISIDFGEPAAIRRINPRNRADWIAIKKLSADPDILAQMDMPGSRREKRLWLNEVNQLEKGEDGNFSYTETAFFIVDPNTQEPVGFINVYPFDEPQLLEDTLNLLDEKPLSENRGLDLYFTWAMLPEARQQGLMSSAVRQYARLIRDQVSLEQPKDVDRVRMFAYINPQNTASQRVAEHSGFKYRGNVYDRGDHEDLHVYVFDQDLSDQVSTSKSPLFNKNKLIK